MKRIAKAKNWSKKDSMVDLQPALRRYQRYLEDRMLAASTTESYLNRVKLFLEWAKTDVTINQFEALLKLFSKPALQQKRNGYPLKNQTAISAFAP